MRDIIIVGSGAVAAELTSYIEDNNVHSSFEEKLNILGYLDSEENVSKYWSRYKLKKAVISSIQNYKVLETDHFIVGISDISFRGKIIQLLHERNAKIIGFLHRTAIISDSAVIGYGNIIYPHCILGPSVILGDNNLLTSYSFISHDCKIGSNNFLATAGISGNVMIGNENYFGIRATVLPNVSIGDNNTIQAGMIVDKSVANDSIVFHRFKEKVIAHKEPTRNG